MYLKLSLTILGTIVGIAVTGLVTALSMSETALAQATHCATTQFSGGSHELCTTPGKEPKQTSEVCTDLGGCQQTETEQTHRLNADQISNTHESCNPGRGSPETTECTVEPSN